MGQLVGPHGVRGETKLRPLTEFPERLDRFEAFRLRLPDGSEVTRRVLSRRWHKQMLLVRFEGAEGMEDAEALRDAEVLIDAAEATPLPEGRYYEHEILGLRVVTASGEELGTVSRVIEGTANDVYVAGPYLIPATRDAVLRLSPEEGLLVVRSREYLEGEVVR